MLQNYKFVWDKFRADWVNLFKLIDKSNLLQSWAYGEAKAHVEGWVPKRGVIYKDNTPIAILQVLEKKWVLGGIVRLNRGPLWVTEPSLEDLDAIYTIIRKQWSLRKRCLLFIAPELPNSSQNVELFSSLGFRPRRNNGWRSAWLDISKSDEELRKGLKSKWRNMLRYAEKAGLEVEVGCSDKDFWWLMEHYRELMNEKKFRGVSIKLLGSLRENVVSHESLLVMKAVSEGKPVAGVLIARHGAACTYLVGWNGPEGRQLKANNFLLWNAVLEMKKLGCIWFDLGGLDETRVAGISAFKSGLGGENYELLGEWW